MNFSTMIILFVTFFASNAFAQSWEVPLPNDDGDYTAAKLKGNRGEYKQTFWIVSESDPAGLNCRTADLQRVVTRFLPGALLRAKFLDDGAYDAIALRNDEYWMMVENRNLHRVANEINISVCFVRANHKYVVPFNEDYLN